MSARTRRSASSLSMAGLLTLGMLCGVQAGKALAQAPTAAATASTTSPASLIPAEVQQALPQAEALGQTRLRVWGFQIYDARLWVAPGFRAPRFDQHAAALELTYLRAFAAADIAARSITEMRRSADISPAQAAQWQKEMQRVFPDIKQGDRLLGVHKPGVGASFWFNGKPAGEIADPAFARLFFGIWLSPQTSEPAMRSALLAGAAQ
jgi:hypothetical protein